MKLQYSILGLTTAATLLLAAGCGKEQPPAGETPKAMNPPVSDMQKAADAQKPAPAPAAPAAAEQPMKAVTNQADATAAAAPNPSLVDAKTQGLIDQAKGLVSNEKYQEALTVVQQLTTARLTPAQRQVVDGLTTQIQTALAKSAASDAASSLGNALGGKK